MNTPCTSISRIRRPTDAELNEKARKQKEFKKIDHFAAKYIDTTFAPLVNLAAQAHKKSLSQKDNASGTANKAHGKAD